jgi:hypothetical protein
MKTLSGMLGHSGEDGEPAEAGTVIHQNKKREDGLKLSSLS